MAPQTSIANSFGDEAQPKGVSSTSHPLLSACDPLPLADQWIHFQRLALMGELTPYLAHDILQPLASICNFSAGLQMKTSKGSFPSEQLSSTLSLINQEAFRASAIAKQLRNHTRSNADDFTWLEISESIRRVLELLVGFLRTKQVVVKSALADGLPRVFASPSGLEQVLLSLIKNAAEAMHQIPSNSRVIEITTSENFGAVQISIEDSGPRISEEVWMNLSQPFFTTKASGMGMGLWTSKTILRRSGGELLLRQLASVGIEAIIRFPIPADA